METSCLPKAKEPVYSAFISLCLKQQKSNLIKTLVHHAIIICSEKKINLEIEFIMKILVENAYSVDIAQAIIRAKIAQINKSVQSICTCCGLLILVLDLLAK